MKFYSKSEFALWFEAETKKYVGRSGSWVAPSEYEKAAKSILKKINKDIEIPSPYGNGGWKNIQKYGEKIWDENHRYLSDRDLPGLSSGAYSSNSSYSSNSTLGYSSQSSRNMTSYSRSSSATCDSSNTPSSGSAIVKRHNFDSALRKIQNFSNQVPYIPQLEKFETDGGLFGLGDHYINGYEMNRYVEAVQDLFKTHNGIILKTIQEFRDVYNTFDYLDREYLTGIVQTANAAAKASEGAKTASNQAKVASDQAKFAAEKALKNEEDLKRDVENLRKLVEKIRNIKEDLSAKIESTNSSISLRMRTMEQELSSQLLSHEEITGLKSQLKTINKLEKNISDWEQSIANEIDKLTQHLDAQKDIIEELTKRLEKAEKKISSIEFPQTVTGSIKTSHTGLLWAYIIGGLGLVCSICSIVM